ncbi:MAG: hypothetical protein JNM70_14680 [Anaerolineae bacterium]|nr:hypothetical protein [Anaerolineae bacterium]
MFNTAPEPIRIQSNFHQFYAAMGAAGTIMGIAVAGVLFMGGGAQELLALFAFLGSFWLLLILITGWNDRRKVRRERADAQSLFEGAGWSQWRWSPEGWKEEVAKRRSEYERTMRFQRFVPVIGAVASLIIGGCALLPVVIGGEQIEPRARVFIIVLAVFFTVLSFLLSVVGAGRERRKWQRRLERSEQAMAPWICFGPYGFYHEVDGHTSLRDLGDVRLTQKGRLLTFYTKHNLGRASSGSYLHPIPLPVPEAHVEDAPPLVRRYREERKLKG